MLERDGGGGKSSDEEDSTRCSGGRCVEDAGCTIGEKLPGALGRGPVDCDMAILLEVGLLCVSR